MRERWNLPDEKSFRYTGDWLQLLLGHIDDISRARILLLLWRVWHLRNDVIHQQGKETIERSVAFLEAYDGGDNSSRSEISDNKGKAGLHAKASASP
jgi:hypothetical protein